MHRRCFPEDRHGTAVKWRLLRPLLPWRGSISNKEAFFRSAAHFLVPKTVQSNKNDSFNILMFFVLSEADVSHASPYETTWQRVVQY